MTFILQRLITFSRENKIPENLNLFKLQHNLKLQTLLTFFHGDSRNSHFLHTLSSPTETTHQNQDELALWIQNILKFRRDKHVNEIEQALDRTRIVPTESLLLNVLRRHRSDWKPALLFFNWSSNGGEFSPGIESHNELLDILGKSRRFEELRQVFDEMSHRKNFANEATYAILLHRFSAAHRVDEAIDVFKRRRELGFDLDSDSDAFRTLLMWLCRYKHVENAEALLYSLGRDFRSEIKTWNIVLNGWCVRGNVHEARRFWKDILASRVCRPDRFTYGIFINALTKKGKLGSAMKLFGAMWDHGFDPDVAICNCVVNGLCFKKRIPEALELVRTMEERGCEPNLVTYNTLIKYMCRIRRVEKVYEILEVMERKRGDASPNVVTFGFVLGSLRRPEEVPGVLERMERNGVEMTCDTLNLVLRLYVDWGCEERVRDTWNEIERKGFGPDRRAYTVVIHGLFEKGKTLDALRYFKEMKSKGIEPEPRTEILMNSVEAK